MTSASGQQRATEQLTAGDMRAEWRAGYQRGLADALRDGLPDRNRIAAECAMAYSQRDDALQELAQVREQFRVREQDVEELRADLDALREQDAPAQVRAVLQWVADTGCTCPGDVDYAVQEAHRKGCPALVEFVLLEAYCG